MVRFPSVLKLLLLLLVVSCGPMPPPALPPEEIIHNAAARMAEIAGFHFVIERSGAPAFLDSDETLSFGAAEGDYVAPDRSRAIVRIIAPGLVTDIRVISIGDVQWETNVLTGQWQELPPDWGFNPTVLFDADIGLQAILTADIVSLEQSGLEKPEDGPDQLLYVVSGEVAGDRLYQMSGGLIGPDPVSAVLWIAPETFELYRVIVTEPTPDGEPSIWQLDFSRFDEVVAIEPPAIEE